MCIKTGRPISLIDSMSSERTVGSMPLLGRILLIGCFGALARGAARIVGGQEASIREYPYVVSLRDSKIGHFCSGAILDENWILTAAHCVSGRDHRTYAVSAGTSYLDRPGVVYTPEAAIPHEGYENFHFNDIALIRVSPKILFDECVKPIAIPNVDLEDNEPLTASFAGWGSTRLGGSPSNGLRKIRLELLEIEECKKLRPAIRKTHVCTYNKISEGICHADSGGPLVVGDYVIGTASYVAGCALGIPDVFTRVYPYVEWINNTSIVNDEVLVRHRMKFQTRPTPFR